MQTDDINGIGTRIKEQRRKLSLTLSDMSAYTGLSNGHLSNIERNQTSPTLANLKRICEALGMSVSDMIKAAPGERTGCAPMETGRPSLTCATPPRPSI